MTSVWDRYSSAELASRIDALTRTDYAGNAKGVAPRRIGAMRAALAARARVAAQTNAAMIARPGIR